MEDDGNRKRNTNKRIMEIELDKELSRTVTNYVSRSVHITVTSTVPTRWTSPTSTAIERTPRVPFAENNDSVSISTSAELFRAGVRELRSDCDILCTEWEPGCGYARWRLHSAGNAPSPIVRARDFTFKCPSAGTKREFVLKPFGDLAVPK